MTTGFAERNISSINLAQQELLRGVRAIIEEGRWEEFLQFTQRFPSYSPRNAMLIYTQASERGFIPTRVGGYGMWKSLGRQVRRGEHGLGIFVPIKRRGSGISNASDDSDGTAISGFRRAYVFDISQTDGRELAEPLTPLLLEGVGEPQLQRFLRELLAAKGFSVSEATLEGMNGRTDVLAKTVEIASGLPPLQALKTLCHETAHALLHSVGTSDRRCAEIEAEAFAFLLMSSLGLNSAQYSFPYIVRWSDGDLDQVAKGIEAAVSLAREILDEYVLSDVMGNHLG